MPIITVQTIKGVVLTTDEQKRELLRRMTDTFIDVVGEVARPYTYCIINETPTYEWSIAGQPLPEADPLRHALDRDQALGVTLAVPLTADKTVDADDIMPGPGQVKRSRPAQVPVDAQYGDRLLSQSGER